jgi:hypothetical protein
MAKRYRRRAASRNARAIGICDDAADAIAAMLTPQRMPAET